MHACIRRMLAMALGQIGTRVLVSRVLRSRFRF